MDSSPPVDPTLTKPFTKYLFRYALLIPVLWLCVALLSYSFPGDESVFKIVGGIPGIWIFLLIPKGFSGNPAFIFYLAGFITMSLSGLLMDWMKVNRYLWISLLLLIGITIFALHYDSPRPNRPVRRNDSIYGYISFASSAGLYLSFIFSILTTTLARLLRCLIPKRSLN